MFWGGDSKKESGLMGRKGKAGESKGIPPSNNAGENLSQRQNLAQHRI
ncbi:hypothetical protein [uncultured Helicobacter sp.]